jgi:hypothetical protein
MIYQDESVTVTDQQIATGSIDVVQIAKGLIDDLGADELHDLLVHLMSGGDPKNRQVYGKS